MVFVSVIRCQERNLGFWERIFGSLGAYFSVKILNCRSHFHFLHVWFLDAHTSGSALKGPSAQVLYSIVSSKMATQRVRDVKNENILYKN